MTPKPQSLHLAVFVDLSANDLLALGVRVSGFSGVDRGLP